MTLHSLKTVSVGGLVRGAMATTPRWSPIRKARETLIAQYQPVSDRKTDYAKF